MIIPTSLFHGVILVNILLAVIFTILLFVTEKRYTQTRFFLMVILLWVLPVFGVLTIAVLMLINRAKPV